MSERNFSDQSPADDPLEDLLQQAFARELAAPPAENLVEQIIRKIAWEQKLRNGLSAMLVVLGLVFAISIVLPAVAQLTSTLTLPALPAFTGAGASLPIALLIAVLVAPWLFALIDDPI